MSQNKDPNWVATFSVTRNKDKFDANGNVITGKVFKNNLRICSN